MGLCLTKKRKKGRKERRQRMGGQGLCSPLVREPVLTIRMSVVEAVVPSK